MNLALAFIAAVALALVATAAPDSGAASAFLAMNLANFLRINVFLAVFNLLPIPPFDGGHVVEGLLPRPLARRYRRIGRFGFPLLVFLLVILPLLLPSANLVARLVVPPVQSISLFLLGLVGLG